MHVAEEVPAVSVGRVGGHGHHGVDNHVGDGNERLEAARQLEI